ncbi:hypothetical protein Q5P01_012766 [Channa striata]|uniref:TIR domain-containing protein n=1 Tax=Channa striata TaxID=64152 RepID=A0AA88MSF6_CHASR|nr:hypothetical protein Q5P01_012766 [Channa striata]
MQSAAGKLYGCRRAVRKSIMEPVRSPQAADSPPQPPDPLLPAPFDPPTLTEGESHHVFISYSSTDYQWTHFLIHQLESCGLQVCYHERDFIPGRTVLENMSDCIQDSQKVLLVLSSEFVRSRWCLLEANMSMFRDCLGRKPIIPVLLEPGVSVPLHLCHLTYLEASDPDFKNKLLKVLCTPNKQLQGSTVVPFQPPSIYNGKALQPVTAVNDENLQKWDCGQFSDMEVPDQLRLVIEDHEKYKKAVRMINSVSQNKVWLRPIWQRLLIVLIYITISLLICFLGTFMIIGFTSDPLFMQAHKGLLVLTGCSIFCVPLGVIIHVGLWEYDDKNYIMREMQITAGQANIILYGQKVLMGCQCNSKIHLVYVSLDGCKREFAETFREQEVAGDMFQRALIYFSSGYACSLAKRHFPFPQPGSTGHLEGGICFCQYVSQQLSRGEWK